jgi:L-2-hydroxyglutarate oxidase
MCHDAAVSHDVAIIGGGIIGMSTAMALAARRPGLDVIVLEKEDQLATHQTGHNSGVIHAGLYYTPGSLKARLCVTGGRRLVSFCAEHGIPVVNSGKVVVATEDAQIPALAELERRATANGVPTERITPAQLAQKEPYVAGVASLWVPETSVVDFGRVAHAYAAVAAASGVEIRTGFEVAAAAVRNGGRRLESPAGWVDARVVVNCGGLHVDRLARMMGVEPDLRIIPFRGEYYHVEGDGAELVNGLIYPVPDPRFPFLGVHFTRDVDGRVEVGPNAVLATAREGYRRTDVDLSDFAESMRYRGLWELAKVHWRTGAGEVWRSAVKRAFVKDANRLLPALTADHLGEYRAGVRAQAVRSDGSLLQDFAIEETPDAVHVLNAPSPGATASLAIGEHIADLVVGKLDG